MKSILEAFADNRINTQSDEIEETEEIRELLKERQELSEKYIALVGEDKRSLFENWGFSQSQEHAFVQRSTFVHGLRLGAITTTEAFMGFDALVKPESLEKK